MAHKVIVIGGANIDIAGTPSSTLVLHDSNPGKITIKAGGVGRNIAENLAGFGLDTYLITALSDDPTSSVIRESCEKCNINLSLAKECFGFSSSIYLYINDEACDMLTAVNDMGIMDEISPEYISSQIDKINSFDACVIDANLRADTIEYIANNVTIPIYADPVSVAKQGKLIPVLDRITALKPNKFEYADLGTAPCRCYVSMGKDGILAIDGDKQYHAQAPVVLVRNTNGCGDMATASIVFGELAGMDMEKTAEFAVMNASKKASLN